MPKRNTNESQPYKIIHATKWSKGGRGEKRTRLIVQEYAQKNPFGKWAVRGIGEIRSWQRHIKHVTKNCAMILNRNHGEFGLISVMTVML